MAGEETDTTQIYSEGDEEAPAASCNSPRRKTFKKIPKDLLPYFKGNEHGKYKQGMYEKDTVSVQCVVTSLTHSPPPQKKYYSWNFKHVLDVGIHHGSRVGQAQLSTILLRGQSEAAKGTSMRICVGDEVRVVFDPAKRVFITRIYGSIEPNQKLR